MELKAWMVMFHAQCMNGTAKFIVVDETEDKAKERFEGYMKGTKDSYLWEQAKKGEKYSTGGYVAWAEQKECKQDKKGVYEQPYDTWNQASDHLWD